MSACNFCGRQPAYCDPAGGKARAAYRLRRHHSIHHRCLGLDRDPPYSTIGFPDWAWVRLLAFVSALLTRTLSRSDQPLRSVEPAGEAAIID